MKKFRLTKMTSFLLLLCMMAVILVSGTYAKYASKATGSAGTTAANWSFKVNGQNIAVAGDMPTVNFALFGNIRDTNGGAETDVAEGRIAPGTCGSFTFTLKNDSEVTAQYALYFTVNNAKQIPIEYSFDGTHWKNRLESIDYSADTVLAMEETRNVTIYWRWPYDGGDTTNAFETVLGTQTEAPGISVTAEICVEQADSLTAAGIPRVEEKQILEDITLLFPEETIAGMKEWQLQTAPYGYQDTGLFAGKSITKIGLPIKKVSAIDDQQTFTIYVLDKAKVDQKQGSAALRTYVVSPKKEDLGTNPNAVNKWVYIDLKDLNIVLSENETLAFAAPTDTVVLGYGAQKVNFKYRFYGKMTGSLNTDSQNSIYLDVRYEEEKSATSTLLQRYLSGKYISILGDSISTFDGYSNSTAQNNTTGNNQIYYSLNNSGRGIQNVNDSWWMQIIRQNGMKLLVNNSSSGSKVVGNGNQSGNSLDQGIGIRPKNLHANTGEFAGTTPDIITVYMGINDFNANYTAGSFEAVNFDTLITEQNGTYTYAAPKNFAEGYAIMLHKIKTSYPDADVFVMNMPLRTASPSALLTAYNDIIAKMAAHYGMTLVDLYGSKISGTAYNIYSQGDNLHPKASGMDLMTKALEEAMIKKYITN